MLRKLGFLAFALLGACASAPPATRPNESGAWGYLKLVPHAGSPAATGAAHAYGDRRLEGVEWVDYSKPGFAVNSGNRSTATLTLTVPLRVFQRSIAVTKSEGNALRSI